MSGVCSAHQGHDATCRLCVLGENVTLRALLREARPLVVYGHGLTEALGNADIVRRIDAALGRDNERSHE
jgi:hypothetical protein